MSRFFTSYLGSRGGSSSSNPRLELSGDVTGSGNLPYVQTTLKDSGVEAGIYSRVEVNSKGIVIRGLPEEPSDGNGDGDFAVRRFDFPEPALEWYVKHNMATYEFNETILDSRQERIYAHVRIIDENEFRIEFTEPMKGSVSVIFNMM